MVKDDILVVKCGAFLKPDKMEELHEKLIKQKETGVIVLPVYCDAVIVPKDTEIRMEENKRWNELMAKKSELNAKRKQQKGE